MEGCSVKKLLVIFLLVPCPALAADLSGRAYVIDGDGLYINGERLRLVGIEAPEKEQFCFPPEGRVACGQLAKQHLENLIDRRRIDCELRGRDKWERWLAVCHVEGESLNAAQVSAGWALAYRYYSRDYVTQEDAARFSQNGIWRWNFIEPWKWRRGERYQHVPNME